MGQFRWVSVLASASAAASWLCTAGAWKLYRSHDLAINNSFEAGDSFLEAQWGEPYVRVPPTKNSDGSLSFIFEQSVNGFVKGHEPAKTPEESGSTGQEGSTGGLGSSAGPSGTEASGGVSTTPEQVGGSSGSTEGPAGNGQASTAPENVGPPENEVVLQDFELGSCHMKEMTGSGPSEFRQVPNTKNIQACHELCLNDKKCNWYTYNGNTKKCHLKGEVGPLRAGFLPGDITGPKYCDSSCYRKNKQMVGTQISSEPKRSPFMCHYQCHMDSRCYYWSWHRHSTQCQLFSNAGVKGVKLVQDIVTGPRSGCGSEAKAGEELQVPEHVVGAPTEGATGSTEGPTSSETVESAPVEEDAGSTGEFTSSGNAEASTEEATGSQQESSSPGNVEPSTEQPGREEVTAPPEEAGGSSSSTQGPTSSENGESAPSEGSAGNGQASTAPENVGPSENKVVLQDFELGSCHMKEMTGSGLSQYKIVPNTKSIEPCHRLCLNEDRCNWYTYNVHTKRCYLKGEVGLLRGAILPGDITAPKYCDSSCYRKNRQIVGTQISSDSKRSPFMCHYQCHMNSRCYYWSWHKVSTQCQLFSNADVKGVRLVQGIVSGPRSGCGSEAKAGEELQVPEHVVGAPTEGATGSTQQPSSPEKEESLTQGAAGNGGASIRPAEKEEEEMEDIQLGACRTKEVSVTGPGEYAARNNVQTLEDCHKICLNDKKCKWYTYNYASKRCHLKANAGPVRHVIPLDVTSPKYCDSSCFIKNRRVNGSPLETSFSGKAKNAFICHYECNFRPACYYWSWNSKTEDCHLFGNTGFAGTKVARGFVTGPRDGCGAEAKEGEISALPHL